MKHRDFDVIVVGGGHAGARPSAARADGRARWCSQARFDRSREMSCNPAIGGVAKGHLVREIDALGGEMGRAIDATGIQFRLLNAQQGTGGAGAAAQADKRRYREAMQAAFEEQPVLGRRGRGRRSRRVAGAVRGVGSTGGAYRRARGGADHRHLPARRSSTWAARRGRPGGRRRAGECGWRADRAPRAAAGPLKTGTPPRLDGADHRLGALEPQPGDADPAPFSFCRRAAPIVCRRSPAAVTDTNARTHEIIRANLDRSPMYPADRGRRPALLPVDRGQGGALRRQGARTRSSSSRRAGRPESTRTASRPRCRRRAGGLCALHPRA